MTDRIEYYDEKTSKLVAAVDSLMAPEIGRFIGIRKQVWSVQKITYALDNADAKLDLPRMRANVDLIRRKDQET